MTAQNLPAIVAELFEPIRITDPYEYESRGIQEIVEDYDTALDRVTGEADEAIDKRLRVGEVAMSLTRQPEMQVQSQQGSRQFGVGRGVYLVGNVSAPELSSRFPAWVWLHSRDKREFIRYGFDLPENFTLAIFGRTHRGFSIELDEMRVCKQAFTLGSKLLESLA